MTTLATKLSVLAGLAIAMSACTVSSSDNNTTDGGNTQDGGTKDTGTTDTGTTDTGTTDGGACEIVITAGPGKEACDKCLNDSCCAEVNGCFGNADCKAFNTCLDGCNDKDAAAGANDAGSELSACIKACSDAHPSSVSAWLSYADCLDKQCQSGSNTSCQ